MAAGQMAQESPGLSLEATALVHEAYLRLVDQPNQQRFSQPAVISSVPLQEPSPYFGGTGKGGG